MFRLIVFICVFPNFALTETFTKLPYSRGTLCNFESYFTWDTRFIHRFFCVLPSQCRWEIQRYPLVPYNGCNQYMSMPPEAAASDRELVCCHQEDITENWAEHWDKFIYIPGVKSYIMCRDKYHSTCGPDGTDYCLYYSDETYSTQFQGLPSSIGKYPHTALIGYQYHDKYETILWRWFCLGSILTKRYVLTMWKCNHDGARPATYVKVGESRICPVEHCPDKDEEQNIEIIRKNREDSGGADDPNDLALFELLTDIQFNRYVRPACLFTELSTRQTQGWFARYSKPEQLMTTKPGIRPKFTLAGETLTAFKVKTGGTAKITFSRTGLPYKDEFAFEIWLGVQGNQFSTMVRSNEPTRPVLVPTPDILDSEQFRGFWLRVGPKAVSVGKEDDSKPLMEIRDDQNVLNLTVVGFSTDGSSGDWIFNDYKALMSVHEFELETSFGSDCRPGLAYDDSSIFCAKNAREKFTPCEDDWGGGLVLSLDQFYCMWSVFAVFTKETPANCSDLGHPGLFKAVNTVNILAWVEDMLYPNFSIVSVNLDDPDCVNTDKSTEGRCFKPL